jgi:hypothetical protein
MRTTFLLVMTWALVSIYLTGCGKKEEPLPTPAFQWKIKGKTFNSNAVIVVDTCVKISADGVVGSGGGIFGGSIDYILSISVTSSDSNTYTFGPGSRNTMTCQDRIVSDNLIAVSGSFNIKSNANNYISGDFSGKLIAPDSIMYMISGSFANLLVRR